MLPRHKIIIYRKINKKILSKAPRNNKEDLKEENMSALIYNIFIPSKRETI